MRKVIDDSEPIDLFLRLEPPDWAWSANPSLAEFQFERSAGQTMKIRIEDTELALRVRVFPILSFDLVRELSRLLEDSRNSGGP